MKKSEIYLQADKSNIEETPKKARTVKLLKSIMLFFMLSFVIAMMTSCFWGRHRGPERHEVVMDHHDDRGHDDGGHDDGGHDDHH